MKFKAQSSKFKVAAAYEYSRSFLRLPGPLRLARNAAVALLRNTRQALSGRSLFLDSEGESARRKTCESGLTRTDPAQPRSSSRSIYRIRLCFRVALR
jgi:hypothetical protein